MVWLNTNEAVVTALFMENGACSIEDPHAVAVGPDISLRYNSVSRSGAYMSSKTLRALRFQFSGLTQRQYGFSIRARQSEANQPLNAIAPKDGAPH
jgi:hypothetical protein